MDEIITHTRETSWNERSLRDDSEAAARNLAELMGVCSLKLCVYFVPSEKNKADVLTSVKKGWLGVPQEEEDEAKLCCVGVPSVRELHQMYHMGVDRTLFVARKVDPAITREKVRQVVRQCDRCQSIDPCPERARVRKDQSG
ncbi:hypothetical protein Pcinc_006959 [Petrolisthes cinctipes]|uniref:Uncharacterized protein n=1 Tax=Petrolisthes cinctipes TaxID=88211 RepID=A0AAE1GC94_PETCI|nr:hypothetical protein Pcinc_006959 [Petrolisthes cinctipes]